nr:unnamed protein product [Spirometra erinaceieuropaei]
MQRGGTFAQNPQLLFTAGALSLEPRTALLGITTLLFFSVTALLPSSPPPTSFGVTTLIFSGRGDLSVLSPCSFTGLAVAGRPRRTAALGLNHLAGNGRGDQSTTQAGSGNLLTHIVVDFDVLEDRLPAGTIPPLQSTDSLDDHLAERRTRSVLLGSLWNLCDDEDRRRSGGSGGDDDSSHPGEKSGKSSDLPPAHDIYMAAASSRRSALCQRYISPLRYGLAKWLFRRLTFLTAESDTTVSSSAEFLENLKVDLPIEAVELLLQSKNDETEDRLGRAQVLQLLKLCLRTYFTFDGTIYGRMKGTPMGLPISGFIAEVALRRLESLIFQHHRPKFRARYVDDTFVVIDWGQLLTFKERLNAVFPDIQFTMEGEENNQLTSLMSSYAANIWWTKDQSVHESDKYDASTECQQKSPNQPQAQLYISNGDERPNARTPNLGGRFRMSRRFRKLSAASSHHLGLELHTDRRQLSAVW